MKCRSESLLQSTTEAAWSLDVNYHCAHPPNLDAVPCETLQLNRGAIKCRKVIALIKVSGKVLVAGNSCHSPSTSASYGYGCWDSNIKELDAFRRRD